MCWEWLHQSSIIPQQTNLVHSYCRCCPWKSCGCWNQRSYQEGQSPQEEREMKWCIIWFNLQNIKHNLILTFILDLTFRLNELRSSRRTQWRTPLQKVLELLRNFQPSWGHPWRTSHGYIGNILHNKETRF